MRQKAADLGRVRHVFVVVTALVASFAFGGPAVAQGRTVRVGVYQNEPKVFTAADGRPTGIFLDLLKEIARKEGWKLVYVPGTWEEGLGALERGRIDLMPDVAYSEERDEQYDFHKTPVVESWSYVYAVPGKRIDRISQLDGRRVAVLRGSIQETVFAQMTKGFGYDVAIVPVSSFEEAFRLASDGEVDAAIANYLFGDYFRQRYGLAKTPIVFNAVPLFYATAQGRDSDLLQAIDRHVGAWIREPDSVYYQTLTRYTATEARGGLPQYVFWILGTIGVLLIVSSGIILLLRWQVRAQTRHLVEAHEAVKRAEETLRLAVEAADEGIWDWYPKTGEIVWTPHSYTMLGYEPDEFAMDADAWAKLVHPDDRGWALDEVWRCIDTGDRSFALEYRLRKKTGDWLWTASRGRAVALDDEGNVERVIGTTVDITERKEVEQAKADFLSSISHELRTPLTVILGNCELAQRISPADKPEVYQRMVSTIKDRAQAMARLIEDMLSVTRLYPGPLELVLTDADVGALVRRSAMGVPITAKHTLSVEVEEGLPPCRCDQDRLGYAISNLVHNAVKFSPEGGTIRVEAGHHDGSFAIRVSDDGVGVPPEQVNAIFEPFSQADMSSSRRFGGVGLGLYVAKRMVEGHGGSIEVDSAPGVGSVFTIVIPDA